MVMWSEMPRSPGHVFYDRLQEVLLGAGFDGFVEEACRAFYAKTMGAPSVPPGRYFRMHMVGYFEGIDSERGIEWRCSDSFSLREFLRLEATDRVPDHSWLSKTRSRLPHEVHETVFGWVLALIAERGLVRGERIGVDASTMEANAALRAIVRRDTGEGYRAMLERMAQESGIATPTAEDLIRLDRQRRGKTLSNEEWVSATDPEARIARMKDGTTHLAYKPEHAVDLDTGAVVAAEVHAADEGDTTTITSTLDAAQRNLTRVGAPPSSDDPAECVADKGYHSRAVLTDLDGGAWKPRIAEPQRRGVSRWHGDADARRAVYNRARAAAAIPVPGLSAAAQQALEQIQGTNEDWIWRQYRDLSSSPTVQREIRAFSEAVERKFGYAVAIERVWPQPTPAQRALFGQVQRQLETARVIGRTLAEEKVKVETLVQSLRQTHVPRR